MGDRLPTSSVSQEVSGETRTPWSAADPVRPRRILFDAPAFMMGGMERQIVDLATGLVNRGHHVAIVVNKSADDVYRDAIASSGAEFTVLGRTNRFDPRVFSDLIGIVRRWNPDVVVSELFNASLWGRLAGILSGAGIVVVEHASDREASATERWTNRLLGSRTHAVVGCAYGQISSLLADGQPKDAIVVVHNGVDTSLFARDEAAGRAFRVEADIADDAFVIGMVAAHRAEKRHDRLIALAEKLQADGVDCIVCAVGGGELFEENVALARRSPAADRIRFLGPRSDVVGAYSAFQATVLVSDSIETLPMAFLESQSCETPVVGMRVGGVEETFAPGVSGFLVEQGDLDEMASVIARMSRNPDERLRMGHSGREFVFTNFGLETMIREYEDVFGRAAYAAGKRESTGVR